MTILTEDQGSTSVHKFKKIIRIPGFSRLFFDLNPKLHREVKTEMGELPLTRSNENLLKLSSLSKGWRRRNEMAPSQNHQKPGL